MYYILYGLTFLVLGFAYFITSIYLFTRMEMPRWLRFSPLSICLALVCYSIGLHRGMANDETTQAITMHILLGFGLAVVLVSGIWTLRGSGLNRFLNLAFGIPFGLFLLSVYFVSLRDLAEIPHPSEASGGHERSFLWDAK